MSHNIVGFTQKIEYLAAKSRLFYWIASQYYRNVIRNEIDLANITKKDRILCIGGGICPFSAILFHQLTGAKVTVIDNDKNCTSEARQVVNSFGLNEYVNVLCRDGGNIDFSLSDFSVIHFALQVNPIEYVFHKVKNQVVFGTKILVRRPRNNIFNKMYSQLTESFMNCCKHIIHNNACNIGTTVLYIKQERLYEEKMAVRSADTSVSYSCPVAV